MTNITTRAGAGRPLTYAEMDGNFNNLNTSKAEKSVTDGLNGDLTTLSKAVSQNAASLAALVKAGLVTTVDSVAAIRALSKDKYTRAVTTGYYLPGDGGHGTYYVDAADTTSIDNGGTILVASDGARWKLEFLGSLSPNQFGAKGDGVTDDTVGWNALIAVINSGGAKSISCSANAVYLTQPLAQLTAADVHIAGNNATVKAKAGSWSSSGDGSNHMALLGVRMAVSNFTIDGNQAAFTASPGTGRCLALGSDPRYFNVTVKNSPWQGMRQDGVLGGKFLACHFDDCANLGAELDTVSYSNYTDTTFDRNGYGFKVQRTNPSAMGPANALAFGLAIRFRSHHLTFKGCSFNDNGREGVATGQGSYAVRFVACLALRNGDGGFTIHADNIGSGRAGDGESCYDLSYVDCEGAGNYTGGLVAYQSVNNLSVIGGRYYNNHLIAGDQATASSYYCGIFIAGGSTGVQIDAKVYDERQSRIITASASGVLTATGWIAGTMNYYPKVAIYSGSDGSFKGYGRITAESAGSVTITPTSYNAVTLSAINVGDYVSQAIQHNGVMTDNNVTGVISADGAGHRVGASGASGRLIYSGGFASGQNIILPKERSSPNELLANPTFDTGITSWSFNTPGGGAANYITSSTVRSAGAVQLVAGSSDAIGDGALVSGSLAAANGEFVEFRIWAYGNSRNDAYIQLFWQLNGTYFSTTVNHPGGGWRHLEVGAFMPPGVTDIRPRVAASAGKTVYYDSATFRSVDSRMDPREFSFPSRVLPY